jgi:hypothetical protein
MKSLRNLTLASLAACILLGGAVRSYSQVSVGVDPGKSWYGYMNVYSLPADGGGYLWGSPWGVSDLPAVFSGSTLTLSPNVSAYNPADPYWVKPDGSGNKQMEANFYVEDLSSGGKTLTFSGLTVANTLASGYYAQAFIKEFGPGYSWVGWDFMPLVGGSSFSVTRAIGAGNITQFGFMAVGPDANPATVGSLGSAIIAVVPEPASLSLLGLGLMGAIIWRRRQ